VPPAPALKTRKETMTGIWRSPAPEAQVDCIAQIKQRADSGRLEAQPGCLR
jgi:hypothetical protein